MNIEIDETEYLVVLSALANNQMLWDFENGKDGYMTVTVQCLHNGFGKSISVIIYVEGLAVNNGTTVKLRTVHNMRDNVVTVVNAVHSYMGIAPVAF